MTLVLTQSQIAQIQREGAEAYPNECCGAMLGKDAPNSRRLVTRLEPLPNSFEAGEQFHRFSLNPKDLMHLEKRAGDAGLSVLGFYHSHPDHPAAPSEYDRRHAWPYYSSVLVSIAKKTPVDLTSWQLDETTEQFKAEEIERSAT
jgi:proteasome lid subunit RPN8/RPN11